MEYPPPLGIIRLPTAELAYAQIYPHCYYHFILAAGHAKAGTGNSLSSL